MMPSASADLHALDAGAYRNSSNPKQAEGEVEEEFQEIVPGWPLLSTSCIFFVEFCERFSTFGARLILSKYMTSSLSVSSELQIVLFLQLFAFFSLGASPIGAIVSDLFAGKFWTLFWTLCLLFVCEVSLNIPLLFFPAGHFGFPFAELFGLLMLAACSGALKPSLAAMGADQFFHIPFNYLEISCFFAIFYFIGTAANLSAVLAFPTMLMFPCFGYESCILLPFAVPATSIFISAVLLICTICLYDRPFGPPVGLFMVYRTIGVIRKALANRQARMLASSARLPPPHWLDHFLDDHNCYTDALCQDKRRYMAIENSEQNVCAQHEFLDQIKALLRVSLIIILTPIFFIFYDQCTDLWKSQALCLDPITSFGIAILPAHLPLIHIILLLLCIPIVQMAVYPLWFRCCCCFPTYLKRMTGGVLLLALAFTTSAVLQHMTQALQPLRDNIFVKIANHFPATCNLTVSDIGSAGNVSLLSREIAPFLITGDDIIQLEGPMDGIPFIRIQPVITFDGDCSKHKEIRYKMNALVGQINYIYVTPQGVFSRSLRYDKPGAGIGDSAVSGFGFSVNLALPCKFASEIGLTNAACMPLLTDIQRALTAPLAQPIVLCHVAPAESGTTRVAGVNATGCDVNDPLNIFWEGEDGVKGPEPMLTLPPVGDMTGRASIATYEQKSVQAGSYQIFLASAQPVANQSKSAFSSLIPVGEKFEITGAGGIYALTIALNGSVLLSTPPQPTVYVEMITPPNMLSIQWQLPQYVLIVFAEILFCITGLEFAYVEAPVVLKSLVLSLWFTSVAIGGLISFILKFLLTFNRLVDHFFFNAAAMFTFAAAFSFFAYYHYVYFNFSLPLADEAAGHLGAAEDSASVEVISASGAVPALDDGLKRASLRVVASSIRRATKL